MGKQYEEDEFEFVSCDVGVYKDDKCLIGLGIGTSSVGRFHDLAKAGIDGAIKTEFSYYMNVDVTMRGDKLIDFLKVEYPGSVERAEKLLDLQEEYTIVCYDMS